MFDWDQLLVTEQKDPAFLVSVFMYPYKSFPSKSNFKHGCILDDDARYNQKGRA